MSGSEALADGAFESSPINEARLASALDRHPADLRTFAAAYRRVALEGGLVEARFDGEKVVARYVPPAELELGEALQADAAYETRPPAPAMDVPGYECLARVLGMAFDQAARGKGKERHANDLPFDRQPMQDLIRMNGLGFATGQVGKKASEALSLPADRAIAELLGVINYAAGAILFIEREGMK